MVDVFGSFCSGKPSGNIDIDLKGHEIMISEQILAKLDEILLELRKEVI